jgi:peptidyl-prolyl cis-trans isomerase D
MLQDFRKVFKGQQALTGSMMLALAVGMLAYLAPSGGGHETPDSVVARVYGHDILKRDLDERLRAIVQRMPRGQDLDAQLPMLQRYALQEMVQQKLNVELADRHGVVVTDAEVRERLEAMLKQQPVFLKPDGTLRPLSEIEPIFRENGITLRQWEHDARTALQGMKLARQIAASVPVDEAWLNRELRARYETVNFETVLVQPDPAPVADPGDGKLAEFLKASGERFRQPPRRVLQFVALDPAGMKDQLYVDDPTLQKAYEAKKSEYQQLKASHILFNAKSDAEIPEAMKKAEALRAKIVAGMDFAKAADENTQDPSGVGKGGDLGWFSHGQMVKTFEDAASALKEGEISQPVRTPFGIHLIKLTGRRVKPFEEAKGELLNQITKERFSTRAKAKLEELRKKGEFAAAARGLNLPLATTKPLLAEDTAVEGLPTPAPVLRAAFAAKVGSVSQVLSAGDQLVVFRVKEELPAAVPPLAEIRAKVLEAWKMEEARRLLAEKVRAAVAGGDLKAAGGSFASESKTLEAYDLAQHPAVRAALLDAQPGKVCGPVWTERGLWAGKVVSRAPMEPVTFEKRKTLVEALQRESGQRLLMAEQSQLLQQGRLRPGFSSLWGRLNGIWMADLPEEKLEAE